MDQDTSSTKIENKNDCSLILFLATPTEEQGLKSAADSLGIKYETIKRKVSPFGEEYLWFGRVGNEIVIAFSPPRIQGRIVMGASGYLGTAARGMRLRVATGAQGIVQLGMAFGIDPEMQSPGDVLVSTAIVPYDTREVKAIKRSLVSRRLFGESYFTDYSRAIHEEASESLVGLFKRIGLKCRGDYGLHFGAVLSGAALIGSMRFRDELVRHVPRGSEEIVGGEMEGVGLLAASSAHGEPVWCIVKGISDFADSNRSGDSDAYRLLACRNAADFVLRSLLMDARDEQSE